MKRLGKNLEKTWKKQGFSTSNKKIKNPAYSAYRIPPSCRHSPFQLYILPLSHLFTHCLY